MEESCQNVPVSRPPTTKEDLARLLAIAGEEELPLDAVTPMHVAQEDFFHVDTQRTAELNKNTDGASLSISARVVELGSNLEVDGPIFRVQSFLREVLIAIVMAALLTSSSLLLVPGAEVYRYQSPDAQSAAGVSVPGRKGGAHRFGTLVRVRSEEMTRVRISALEDEPLVVKPPISMREDRTKQQSRGKTRSHPTLEDIAKPRQLSQLALRELHPEKNWS